MTRDQAEERSRRSWWLALLAVALGGPWPGWSPPVTALAAAAAALGLVARPRGRDLIPWAAVALAVGWSLAASSGPAEIGSLEDALGRHCARMLEVVEDVAGDPDLQRLYSASGEALEPELPFTVLGRHRTRLAAATLYLADDRGRVVAWAGAEEALPADLRPLGQRAWSISWSATAATLSLREPVLIEGRLVGAVLLADRVPLETDAAWGMRAPPGRLLRLGRSPGTQEVAAPGAPAVVVPVRQPIRGGPRPWAWLGWFLLGGAAVALRPAMAWLVAVAAGFSLLLSSASTSTAVTVVLATLLVAAAAARLATVLAAAWARVVIMLSVTAAAGLSLAILDAAHGAWLPTSLVRPGWGGVWMVAAAWLIAAWPTRGGPLTTLSQRLALAAALGAVATLVGAARNGIQVLGPWPGAEMRRDSTLVRLPRGELDLEGVLPVAPDRCQLDDVAARLGRRWGLGGWRTPATLQLVDQRDRRVLSTWGDLTPAGSEVRLMRDWQVEGGHVELWVATEPWSWLADWRTGRPREVAARQPVWFAVLTRSGSVAATLHPEIGDLDPAVAGSLFHDGGGWTVMRVAGSPQLARVWRRGEWLVAAVSRSASLAVWVVQAAMATVWAFLGLVLARPPRLRRTHLETFGGRLRVLVGAGVVLPLVILTVFLHLRLRSEELRQGREIGLDALGAARYTAVHLAGGVPVDNDLARWLAAGWRGEVVVFDGADLVASSRPDLTSTGVLPTLPAPEAFRSYLLGRDDAVVVWSAGWLTAAGAVELQGQRLLLELLRLEPVDPSGGPGVVDWLLTGAVLAALVVLVLTSRVERRLSLSLRDLVALARKLLHGEPVGEVRRPRERDLAEVLDAVHSMNREVQQREQSLRNQEELLRITLSTLTAAVIVLEPGGRPRFTNPSAERMIGEYGDLVLDQIRTLAGAVRDDAVPVVDTVQPVAGRDVTWRIGLAPVPFSDGGSGLVAVVDDVSEVVRVDRLRQLNQLARIVAHEVKNPLTPVRLWVQELEEARRRGDDDLDRLLADACREIAVQVERLQATATSFSNLVALERWDPQPVDMADVVRSVLSGRTVLERRGIRTTTSLAPDGTCIVLGDREWLLRAVGNLLQNSVDALAGEPGTIEMRLQRSGDQVCLEVEDSAGGVPEEQLPSLFSPHFSTTSAGSGLGLALVHQVVTRCQGSVSAVNGSNGLRVTLELPAASATMAP